MAQAKITIGWYVENDSGEIQSEDTLDTEFIYEDGDSLIENDEVNTEMTWNMMESIKTDVEKFINTDDFDQKMYTFFDINCIEIDGATYNKDESFDPFEAGRLFFDADNNFALAVT